MKKHHKERLKPRKLPTTKKPEDDPILSKTVDNESDIDMATDEPIVYDYMKYPAKKKNSNKVWKKAKVQKNVSFKMMVELVTYTDDWKMKMIEGRLRTEEEQVRIS